MKTKHHSRRGLSRLVAILLCALCVIGLFPMSAFALEPGTKASSWMGDQYLASDGDTYYHPAPWYSMTYHEDGSTSYVTHGGGSPYNHYMLTDSSGVTHTVYCIESGIDYGASDNAYTAASGKDSNYFKRIPAAAQRGIELAALYGWQPGASLPISGINADDWKMATQVIIWEYQQQLRTGPGGRQNNGSVYADQFYNVVKGRPAEKAYNYILQKIASHTVIPSFAAASSENAPVLELKWDSGAKIYTLTVTDTNALNIDLERLSGRGVSVTRNGNSYTFTSKNMIMDPVTFTFRKNVKIADQMLIWGRPGYQTMMTGASDPVIFSVKVKTETYGTAKIVKTSEDGIVSGISFNIKGSGVDQTVKTDNSGTISQQLLPGTYTVTELPSERYVAQKPQTVTIESGQTATVHFSNILKKFRVKGYKVDAETGDTQGDATLGGAVYGLFDGDKLVDTYTTGPDGSFETRYYVCGDNWTIREIDPSTGYLLNDTVYPVGGSAKLYELEFNTTENTLPETVKKGNIQLVKHVDEPDPDVSEDENGDGETSGMVERPEAGAVFEIYLKRVGSYENAKESERDRITTDQNGFAASKDLPYGRYTVHQVSGEEGKAFVPDFTVFISEDGKTYSYILNNTKITARIKVEKRDAETGNIIPLPGTGFQIKDLSTGEFVKQEIYYPNPETLDTFYVSDEGWLMLPEVLAYGNYELYEVAAPYGYVLSGEAIPFTVDGSETVVTVTQYNMPQKGQITISKTGEVFFSVQENEGLYQPVYEIKGLPGASYDLIADEDIYTGDGTLRVEKDTVVETLTTGNDGIAESGLLYLGKYRLEEREAPYGCVLNEKPEYVELSYAGETVEVTEQSISLYDERQKAGLDLTKAMEKDELFKIGDGEEYKDVYFGLYAAKELVAVDGTVIPEHGLLEAVSIVPNEDGNFTAIFATDLPFGSYYIKERTTNAAYVISDMAYPVEFSYAGQDTAIVVIHVNEGKPIENDLLRGRVEGVKYGEATDGSEPKELAGALMGLFGPDTESFTKDTAIMTCTTGENGAFVFENIPYGHFIVAEIEAPALYTVSPERHHIYIGTDDQVITIRVDNTLIRGSVQVIKTEAVAESSAVENTNENTFMRFLPGAEFALYEDTNGNKEFDSEDKQLGKLTETDGGYHTAENLLAGGYFIKESKAPKGYIQDEKAYFFAITEDGQVAVIENGEKGRGFTNEAFRGNLKIVKDSSDGRKDGFAIEVKSADGSYCETFTTPKDGVIEVKGLRVGVYTVTEVANRASRDYIIPDAATVEIKADETATVQLFNEKPDEPTPEKPTTPGKPVPQTGDDNFIFLWGGLLAAAVIGGVVFAVIRLKKSKGGKNDKAVNAVVLLFCVALAVGSGCKLMQEIAQYKDSAAAYDQLAEAVKLPETRPEPSEGSETEADSEIETETPEPLVALPVVDFAALRETNADIIAWLYQPDTAINYPVMQTDNNDYYLNHLFDGTYSKVGAVFADYENKPDFSDRNTVIYGHNMRDGSMLASLNAYKDQLYFGEHPELYLITPEAGYIVEIFSAFSAGPSESGSDTSPWRLDFRDDGAYSSWISAMVERSVIETGTAVTGSDKVLTLSTCAPGGETRFVVMGKLTRVNN